MSSRTAKQYKETIISTKVTTGKVTEKVTTTPITSQLIVRLNKCGGTETLNDMARSIKTLQKKFRLPQTGTMNGTVAKQLSNLGKSSSNEGTGGTTTKSQISNKDLITMNPVKMMLPSLIGLIVAVETPQKVSVQTKLEKVAVNIGATYMVMGTLDNLKDSVAQEIKNVFFADNASSNEESTFKHKLGDIQENPEEWQKTGSNETESSKKGNKGGKSIEEEYANKKTGEKVWKHILEDSDGNLVEEPHYRPFPKQLK